jgi:hypothetical protein
LNWHLNPNTGLYYTYQIMSQLQELHFLKQNYTVSDNSIHTYRTVHCTLSCLVQNISTPHVVTCLRLKCYLFLCTREALHNNNISPPQQKISLIVQTLCVVQFDQSLQSYSDKFYLTNVFQWKNGDFFCVICQAFWDNLSVCNILWIHEIIICLCSVCVVGTGTFLKIHQNISSLKYVMLVWKNAKFDAKSKYEYKTDKLCQ